VRKVIFEDWIVELGRDPATPPPAPTGDGNESAHSERTGRIIEQVRAALDRLPETDREFLERFYFMGQGYRQLADTSGRSLRKLEALHRRAVRRLRRELRSFVRAEFGLDSSRPPACPICRSPARAAIDRLIAGRDQTATWRPIIRELRQTYEIEITTPQILIGHEQYH